MNGGYRALQELKDAGEIKAIGLGVNETEIFMQALADAVFDMFLLAGRYKLLEHNPLNDLFPLCEAHGVSVVVGGP